MQGGSTLRDFIAVNGQSGYFQQTYFVIKSYDELFRATVDTDFAPLYARLADDFTYKPETVLPEDGIIQTGTQAYARARAGA